MSSNNGFIPCAHVEQFKVDKDGLKMYRLVYSSLIAICNQDALKRKVRSMVIFILVLYFGSLAFD